MANLRANKITSTEVFETTGSVQFDGSGDYLSLASSADFSFGTGDFTVEFWLYRTDTGNNVGLLDTRSSNVDTNGWFIRFNSSTTIQLVDSAIQYITATHNSGWNHITFVRKSGIITGYINGIFGGSTNTTKDFTSSNFLMGGFVDTQSSPNAFGGHISNLRVLKGTALYTKNFTPPSRELTVIPNTVLLACTSTTNTAQEATGKTITVNGNAVANELTPGLLTDRVKSGGTSAITGSVEFGKSDYLSLADSTDLDLATGDFTIETWFYYSGSNNLYPTIFGNNPGAWTSGSIPVHIDHQLYPNKVTLWVNDYSGGVPLCTSQSIITYDSWNHLVISRSGTIIRLFYNGNLESQSTISSSLNFNMNIGSFRIGGGNWNGINGDYNGFISNLRVLKGTALYTGSFIPPSRELKKIPNTVLLCCKNSSDPTAEETGKTITANGDPAASNFTPQIGSDGSVTFDGVTKINTQNYFYIPTGNTENRGRGRGVFTISTGTPENSNAINYLQISSSGNSIDFGDLTSVSGSAGSVSSSTRMIIALGNNSPVTASPGNVNTLDYLTIATTSNTLDFGDLTTKRGEIPGVSNSTRGVFIGGINELVSPYSGPTITYTNTMDYISIASLGNALDFGDSHSAAVSHASAVGNTTRGVYTVSWNGSTTVNNINYITISTTGNGQDFGDLITPQNRQQKGSVSNSTRGLFAGGISPVSVNTIEYITITSLGNAQDFGDLSYARRNAGGTSNSIRGVFAGGYDAPPGPLGRTNVIDYAILASTGNASDFGDLLEKSLNNTGASDSHGGLS